MKEIKKDSVNQLLRLLFILEKIKYLNQEWEQETHYLEQFIQKGYDILGSLVGATTDTEVALVWSVKMKYSFAAMQILMNPLQVEQKAYENTN